METAEVEKNSDGYVVCNEAMLLAFKSYIKDKELADDKIDKTIFSELQKDAESYYKLGSRILVEGMTGTDVTKLQNLLIDKILIKGNKKNKFDTTKLDKTMCKAIEKYLDQNDCNWRGVVDSQVINILMK